MKFKKVFESLSQDEGRVFSQIISQLKENEWDGIEHLDEDWGWIILADKSFPRAGVILRRIKPYQIKKDEDLERAKNLQQNLRRELIEVFPYKIIRDKNGTRKMYFYDPMFSF